VPSNPGLNDAIPLGLCRAKSGGAVERDLQVASMGERERREISVWTLKRRERRAPPTGCAAQNYFTSSTTSISIAALWIY
jgi:hypothetical protein